MPIVADIFNITKGKKVNNSFSQKQHSYIRYIQIEDLRNDDNLKYTDEKELVLVDEDDVIIAWDGAYAGTASFGLIGIIGSTLARLRITEEYKDQYNSRYLGFFLQTKFEYLQNTSTGATIPHVSKSALTEIEVPLPDLDTQNKIVAILGKANSLVKKRKENIAQYDELLRATFLEMFGDPKERHSRWNIDSIGANLQDIIAGTSYGGEEKDSLDDDELGVLKISAVTKGIFNPKEFKAVKKGILKKEPVFPKEGDLLFSRANTLELVGATCIVDKDYNHLFLPDKIWKVITDESKLKRVYLNFVLQSKSIRESFINIATGSSGSMLNISMDKFKSIQIPVPPIELQEKFEAFYYKCRANIEKLNSSQLQMELLQKALSQQAFIGKSQFDIDLEIEALLTSFSLDDKQFKNKRTVVNVFNTITRDQTYFQRILDKLDEQEYKEASLYNKAKGIIFRALNKNINRIQQFFVERDNTKRLKLTVNEIIEA